MPEIHKNIECRTEGSLLILTAVAAPRTLDREVFGANIEHYVQTTGIEITGIVLDLARSISDTEMDNVWAIWAIRGAGDVARNRGIRKNFSVIPPESNYRSPLVSLVLLGDRMPQVSFCKNLDEARAWAGGNRLGLDRHNPVAEVAQYSA